MLEADWHDSNYIFATFCGQPSTEGSSQDWDLREP